MWIDGSLLVCHRVFQMLMISLWISPKVLGSSQSMRAIRACSTTLAIFGMTFVNAQIFHELFEYLSDQLLLHIEASQHSNEEVLTHPLAIRSFLEGDPTRLQR